MIVDSVVKVDASKPAVHTIWFIWTDLLRDIAIALLIYGLVAIVAGILAGPSRLAVSVRFDRRADWCQVSSAEVR